MTKQSIVLCTLVLNEIEWLAHLYDQHHNWPGMLRWIFIESADRVYAETNPGMVSANGLSTDGTTEFLLRLADQDKRVTHVPFGFSTHGNPAQGKCSSRSAYLRLADKVGPAFLFVLDADEFYSRADQHRILDIMAWSSKKYTGFCFRHRHPWRPPSLKHECRFAHEVTGGFWDIPLCRGWRWQHGLVYQTNHNTPETQKGQLLDRSLLRLDRAVETPECIHMAFASNVRARQAKHRYYAARGEGRVDFRGWYVESRAAFETWAPGDSLPRGAKIIPYTGPVPECFADKSATHALNS